MDGAAPVEGDGIYSYVNEFKGKTSVAARGGRVITKVANVEAADQAALMRAAQLTIDADTTINAKVTTKTSPNPMHWHFDRITLDDSALGMPVEALATQWTYTLNGGDMSHEWTVI